MRDISVDLQNTVIENPKIKKVYFDKLGRHYFNTFILPSSKPDRGKSKEWPTAQFGQGLFSHKEKVEVKNRGTVVDEFYEDISFGDKSTLIVEELSREEIISYECKVEGDNVAAQIANSSSADKQMLLGALGLTVEDLKFLQELKASKNTNTTEEKPFVLNP